MKKLTIPLAAAVLAASVGLAFAQSGSTGTMSKSPSGSMSKSGAAAPTTSADKNKMTGCNTTASKEEKGKQGSVANSSSHNAATTGSGAAGKQKTGC